MFTNACFQPLTIGPFIAGRLRERAGKLAAAACEELGLPVSFIHEQIAYSADSLNSLRSIEEPIITPEVAFLFPSNTEGAMPVYLLAMAAAMGFRIHAKLSSRCPAIQHCLQEIFAPLKQISFHTGSGRDFLAEMLADPAVQFLQVFGDDAWILNYEDAVRRSGKTFAFDGPGKDPVIVLEGSDLGTAVEGAIACGLFAGGAACMSPERFLVHEHLLGSFLHLLAKRLAAVRPKAPDHPDAVLGYLYSSKAAARLKEQLAEATSRGAEWVLRGAIWPIEFRSRSFHACEPSVLYNLPPDSRLLTEETFGPVFPVQPFRDNEEAIKLAESTEYGLTATIFGSQPAAQYVASRLRLSHAIVYINQTMLEGFQPEYWGSGGYRKSGWVWETDANGTFHQRSGYRPLHKELKRVKHLYNEESNDSTSWL